jgi:hypothetical protein
MNEIEKVKDKIKTTKVEEIIGINELNAVSVSWTMTEHPIFFKTPMIQAILNTKPGVWPARPIDSSKPYKWQTRRPIKFEFFEGFNPGWAGYSRGADKEGICLFGSNNVKATKSKRIKFHIGDALWVRETYRCMGFDLDAYSALVQYKDETSAWAKFDNYNRFKKYAVAYAGWKPSIFLPREFSRIKLEVKRIRIEWVEAISEDDARAEGVYRNPCIGLSMCGGGCDACESNAPYTLHFKKLWNVINGKTGYSWERNPLVVVYEFMRIN